MVTFPRRRRYFISYLKKCSHFFHMHFTLFKYAGMAKNDGTLHLIKVNFKVTFKIVSKQVKTKRDFFIDICMHVCLMRVFLLKQDEIEFNISQVHMIYSKLCVNWVQYLRTDSPKEQSRYPIETVRNLLFLHFGNSFKYKF